MRVGVLFQGPSVAIGLVFLSFLVTFSLGLWICVCTPICKSYSHFVALWTQALCRIVGMLRISHGMLGGGSAARLVVAVG